MEDTLRAPEARLIGLGNAAVQRLFIRLAHLNWLMDTWVERLAFLCLNEGETVAVQEAFDVLSQSTDFLTDLGLL